MRSTSGSCASIAWTGWKRKIPVLIFRADALVCRGDESKQLGGKRLVVSSLSPLLTLDQINIVLSITRAVPNMFNRATRSIARYMLRQRGWLAGCLSHAGIVSKRLNLS